MGAKRLMSPEVAKLFTEAGPGEVLLPDCTQLDAPLLAALLTDCATPRYMQTRASNLVEEGSVTTGPQSRCTRQAYW